MTLGKTFWRWALPSRHLHELALCGWNLSEPFGLTHVQVLWINASFTQGVWVFAKTTGQPPGMRWHHAAEAFDGARFSRRLSHRIARVLDTLWVYVTRTLFVGLWRLNRTGDGSGGHCWV